MYRQTAHKVSRLLRLSPRNVTAVRCFSWTVANKFCYSSPRLSLEINNDTEIKSPTIYALSTPPGKSAISVIRVTGPGCKYIFKKLTKRSEAPKPRSITYSAIYEPNLPKSTANILDHAVILYFQSPKSYTGEDIIELQLHGGNAIVKSVLNALMKTHNPEQGYFVRYAEAGEFSKRAFQNGVLDLTQVEGIRDSIDAETETQRKAAMAPASGRMKIMYDDWRKQIVDTMALLTALIDFSEDSDITSAKELFNQSRGKVNKLLGEIKDHYKVIKRSELLVSGIRLDFLGPPNAGKSYLLNRLAERDAAIVSDVPGTTRDVLELSMDISGYKVVLGDTAGLRSVSRKGGLVVKESTDDLNYKIELEGMKRAKQRFKNSDIVLCILPLSQDPTSVSISPDVLAEIKDLQNLDKRIIVALNKEDLVDSAVSLEDVKAAYANTLQVPKDDILSVSCLTEKGITDLVQKLVSNFENMTIDTSSQGYPIGASQRTKDILQNEVVAGLEGFLAIDDETEVVIATEELRFAAEGIGKITGQGVGVEEVLGVVFSSFCIGK